MTTSRIAKPNRILLVALDNLGDLVFASALTPPLRSAFPDATIDIWSKTYTAAVARLVPNISSVIDAEPFWAVRRGTTRPPLKPVLRAIRDLRNAHYDVAILSGAPWRTAAAVAAARIPTRIGLARHRNRFFLSHVLPAENKHRAVLLEQARLLEPLGINSTNPRYSLDTAPLAQTRAELARVLPEQFVALHPFASSRDRCVPLGEWTQVAFALAARHMTVLWIGTTTDLNELRSMTLPKGIYIDQIGDGSLTATAAALSMAASFAGHDSGPLHVAGAFGIPVVGVFAPGEPDRTFPQGIGPSRMISRPSPEGIAATDILRELDALEIVSAT
ncbi:MAG TPA: glycosyltransferase family 9 protein [Gemmatimonadaceae bacterium]|jgi:ADP-heptose:LPS heptosyltransferase